MLCEMVVGPQFQNFMCLCCIFTGRRASENFECYPKWELCRTCDRCARGWIAKSKSPEGLQCHQVLGRGASTANRPFSGPKLYQKEKCKLLFCQSLNFQAGYCRTTGTIETLKNNRDESKHYWIIGPNWNVIEQQEPIETLSNNRDQLKRYRTTGTNWKFIEQLGPI